MAARCLPRRRRAQPARAPLPLLVGAARSTRPSPSSGGFVQAAVDAYVRTGHRPPWLSHELLAVLERQGRLVGLVYLLHFDRPIGDTSNPRSFAAHYTGWTLDLPGRLQAHAAGRGARLMEVVGEVGIGWQLARIWPGTRVRERSLKGSGGAARRCPVCQLGRLGLAPARPADLFAFEVGARAAAYTAHRPSSRRRWPHEPHPDPPERR
jgi:hypothetical protein